MNQNTSRSHQVLKSMPKQVHNDLVPSHIGVVHSLGLCIQSEEPRPHKCPFCGRPFRRSEHVKRHVRVHTREKPYVCQTPQCMKTFSRSDDLIRHSRIHSYSRSSSTARTSRAVTTYIRKTIRRRESWTDPARTLPSLMSMCTRSAPTSVAGSPLSMFSSYDKCPTSIYPHLGTDGIASVVGYNKTKDAVDAELQSMTTFRSKRFKHDFYYRSPPHSPSSQFRHILCSNNKSDSFYTTPQPHYLIEHQGCFCGLAKHNWPESLQSSDLMPAVTPRSFNPKAFDHAFSSEAIHPAMLSTAWSLPIETNPTKVATRLGADGNDRHDGGVGKQMRALRISDLLS